MDFIELEAVKELKPLEIAKEKVTAKANKYLYQQRFFERCFELVDEIPPSAEDDFYTLVYKIYLRVNSLKNAADVLNEMGFRFGETKRRYQSNDIAEIIRDKDIVLDNLELQASVKRLLHIRVNGMSKFL